nr:unnamed protein product [Digitaria exilis]
MPGVPSASGSGIWSRRRDEITFDRLQKVFEDAIIVDWRHCLSEPDGSYHHFEWAIGTDEGESDIFGFEDVGLNAQVHRNGINLDQFEDYFITLRAWRLDGHYTELCVKAHALKGQSCVHHRLIVGDGFVTMTKGESIRNFFEHAEEAEEEDEDDAMDRDGNDFDGEGSHPQKHAKSPELAREFLLDAAAVIFKEQVEKAFREGTAQQNAHSVFVSLALRLLEERVHIACKEIITLEKQNKLLEEEEKEKREEQERRMKRRTRDREKKLRRKERLKEKENKGKRLVEPKSPDDASSSALSNSSTSTNDDSTNTLDSRDSATEEEDDAEVVNLSGKEMKVARKSGIEKPRVQYRRCYPLDSFVVSKGTRIGSTQKNANPKQVWEPMDSRKKTPLDSTVNAAASVDNVDPLKPVDCDTSGCQKLGSGFESQPLASESSRDVCKSDQPCGITERSQAAARDDTLAANKQNCYPGNDEGSMRQEEMMTNSAGSDSSSSYMSEGDRESSSSSMTSSSTQNPESSSSDESEESPDGTKSTYNNVNPYLAPAFSHMPTEPVHKTAVSFRAMPPAPPFQSGPQQIAGHAHIDMNLERHPSKLKTLLGKDLLEDKNKSGLKDPPEDKNKSQEADAAFSLFQFNLPIASPVTPSSKSKDVKNGELVSRTPMGTSFDQSAVLSINQRKMNEKMDFAPQLNKQNLDGRTIQSQLTAWMEEKIAKKFMKELWSLLLSEQEGGHTLPQQLPGSGPSIQQDGDPGNIRSSGGPTASNNTIINAIEEKELDLRKAQAEVSISSTIHVTDTVSIPFKIIAAYKDPGITRRLFERALDSVGSKSGSSRVWDLFIEYESSKMA